MSAPSAAEWQSHRQLLTRLYVHENAKVKDIRQRMLQHHGFKATEKMYSDRFSKWRIDKKMKDREARAIVRAVSKRSSTGRQAPYFRLRGRAVTLDDARRSLSRKKRGTGAHSSDSNVSTPTDLSVISEDDNFMECFENQRGPRQLDLAAFIQEEPSRPLNVAIDDHHNAFLLRRLHDWYTSFSNQQASDTYADVTNQGRPLGELRGGAPKTPWQAYKLDHTLERLWSAALPLINGRQAFFFELNELGSTISMLFENPGLWLIPRLAKMAHDFGRFVDLWNPKECEAQDNPEFAQAFKLVRSFVVRAARETMGEHHPLSTLCEALLFLGTQDLIEQVLRQILVVMKTLVGKGSEEDIYMDLHLARHYRACGKFTEGARVLTDALHTVKLIYGPEARQVREVMRELGGLYFFADDLQNAETIYLQVIQHSSWDFEHQLPDRNCILAMDFLSVVYQKRHQWDQCEYWCSRAIQYKEMLFGSNDVGILVTVNTLGRSLWQQSKRSAWLALRSQWPLAFPDT